MLLEIILYFIGVVLIILSIPALIEIAMFIVANIFIKEKKSKITSFGKIKIGVVIPAYNEEKNIVRCVESIKNSNRGNHDLEIVVIADNCDDKTAERAKEVGATVIERFNKEKVGKGAALDYAFNILIKREFDAFMVVDADTVVDKNFVEVVGDNFARGEHAVQTINLVLNKNISQKTRFTNLALLSMNLFRPLGREKLGFSVGLLGNGFGLSKEIIEKIPYTANSITEDLEYHIQLIEAGERVKFVAETKVLADCPLSDEGNETQRARWEGGRFLLQRQYGPKLLLKILKGKLKLLEPFLELMSMPLSYEVIMLLFLLAIPISGFRVYSIIGIAIITIHIALAVLLYGDKEDLKALRTVPKYIFWKIIKFPLILSNSKSNVKWVRTKRD